MKYFYILFFVGWFFAVSDPLPDVPGAFFTYRLGPFSSEATCRAYRGDLLDALASFGVTPATATSCEEYKGA